jgi:ABC-type transport system involved in multi-copper enzyme maturation permease subunit
MKALLYKEWRETRLAYLIFLILLLATAAFIPLTFDWVKRVMENAPSPPAFQSEISFILKSFPHYIWSQWFPKNLIQFGVIFTLVLGASSLAGEFSRGTFEFLFTKPVKRRDVFLVKVISRFLGIAIVFTASTLFYGLISYAIKPSIATYWKGFILSTVAALFLTLLAFSLAVFFSAFFSSPLWAGVSAFLPIIIWVIIESRFSPKWKVASSLLQADIFLQNKFPLKYGVIILFLSLVIFYLAWQIFKKREVK